MGNLIRNEFCGQMENEIWGSLILAKISQFQKFSDSRPKILETRKFHFQDY